MNELVCDILTSMMTYHTADLRKGEGAGVRIGQESQARLADGRDQGRGVQTFEDQPAAVCRGMCSNPVACVCMLMHCVRMLMHYVHIPSPPTGPLVRADSVLEHQDALDWPSDASADGEVDG